MSVGRGWKRRDDGAELADRKLPEAPVILLEGELVSLSMARSQVHQFLTALYPVHLG